MQVFIGYQELDFDIDCEDPMPKLLPNVVSVFENDYGFKVEKSDRGNAGRGADWIGLLVWFGATYGIFSQGKTINENLDGWIGIAKKLNKLIETLKKKFGPVRLCQETARVLALGKVLESQDVQSAELSHEHKVTLNPLEWRPEGQLDREPEAYYYFFFNVEREGASHLETITVKSNGEILEHNKRSLEWPDF